MGHYTDKFVFIEEYDIVTEAFKRANVSHYLDKENMRRQRGSDDL